MLLRQLLALRSSWRGKKYPVPWKSLLPDLVTTSIWAPEDRPNSAGCEFVMTFISAIMSMLVVARVPPLEPVSTLVTPSSVKLFWLLRFPFDATPPNPPVYTIPGSVLVRSKRLRPVSARSTTWRLVRTPERSALAVCTCDAVDSTVTVSFSAPTVSTMSPTETRSLGNTWTSFCSTFLNPGASTVRLYVPGCTCAITKAPSVPVVASRVVPCCALVSVILALMTTACWLSFTTPVSDPEICCAKTPVAQSRRQPRVRTKYPLDITEVLHSVSLPKQWNSRHKAPLSPEKAKSLSGCTVTDL